MRTLVLLTIFVLFGCFTKDEEDEESATIVVLDGDQDADVDADDGGSVASSDDAGDEDDTGGSGGGDDGGESGGSTSGSPDEDQDNDGHTADVDCDDNDSDVFPGADDSTCDGIDNDCDGWADSDWNGDPWEPNDIDPVVITDIEGEVVMINDAYLHLEVDADVYKFYADDGWFDWFNVDAEVTDVPGTVDIKLQLFHVETEDGEVGDGLLKESDEKGLGGDESVGIGEGWFVTDKTGWFEVVVTSVDGSSCTDPYTLVINADAK